MENTKVRRPVIYDAESLYSSRHKNIVKRRKKIEEIRKPFKDITNVEVEDNQEDSDYQEPISLELQPILSAVKAYGRKTNALGMCKTMTILSNVINKLRSIEMKDPIISEVLHDIEIEYSEMKNSFVHSYEL